MAGETCPTCAGKGYITCVYCKGTGDTVDANGNCIVTNGYRHVGLLRDTNCLEPCSNRIYLQEG